MNRFLSMCTALITLVISGYIALIYILDKFNYTIEFNWLTDTVTLEIVFGVFLLSILTLISFGGRSNRESKVHYVEVATEYGQTRIAKSVFEDMVGRILSEQTQVSAFKLRIDVVEHGIHVHMNLTPNFENEGSFVELTKTITEQVKSSVLGTTSVTVENVSYSFESPKPVLVKKD